MEHIGQKIKDLRKKADLTQDRLADYLGVSAQAVSKWELGQTAPDLSLIAPLCRVLGCSADELLGVETEQEDPREHELFMMASGNDGNPDQMNTRLQFEKCLAAAQEYPRNLWLHYYCAMNEAMLDNHQFPTEEQAKARIASQHSDEFFRQRSDYVIENKGSEQELTDAAVKIIDDIAERAV